MVLLEVVLHGLAGRKLRTALTAIAVVLGVGLIAGTYILTDTINRSFDGIFATANEKIDVVVSPRQAVKAQDGAAPPAFPAATLAEVRKVPGVAQAEGGVFNLAQIYDAKGKKIGSQGPPTFVGSVQPETFSPYQYTEGRPPRTADEVALDPTAAENGGFKVGDKVGVASQQPKKDYTLVGIAKFGEQNSIGGASIALMTLPEAQRVLGEIGRFDEIDVRAEPGTGAALASRLRTALPASVAVRTGAQQASSQASDVQEGFAFLRTVLLIFAGVVLFVGAFMIFNTFSITVAQRMREFALLRTIGASRAQVMRSVVFEALLVGLVASVVGLLLGLLMAPGLKGLFKLVGFDLPAAGTVVQPRTIVVSLLVGVVLTVVSSLAPALRATRVPPIAALREGAVLPRGRIARLSTPLAVTGLALGAVLILLGLFAGTGGSSSAALVGAGAAVIFLAVALLSKYLVRPLASVVGIPMERLRGMTGRLARENATRNPGRTASTAAALMIGMALVTFVTILAAGIKESVADSVEKGLTGAFVVQNPDGRSAIPGATAGALRQVPGIDTVIETRFSQAKVRGIKGTDSVTGVDPQALSSIYRVDWKKGSDATLRAIGPADAVVKDKWATDNDIKVGQTLTVLTPSDRTIRLTVKGTYEDDAQLLTDLTVSNATIVRDFGSKDVAVALAGVVPGQSVDAVKKRAETSLEARFPSVEVLTKKEFTDDVASQINQLLSLFYVLLGLAVIVSLFGLVNTLALSIYERTRELGMVRAIGMSRRQVRTTVRYESVITALIGAVLGLVLGVLFAIAMTPTLADQGLKIAIPVGTLIVLALLAAIAGVLAAVGPARRASHLDMLKALAYE
ncbi:MAG: ABC transporter permease [Solirubrobacteraceae bacterium]